MTKTERLAFQQTLREAGGWLRVAVRKLKRVDRRGPRQREMDARKSRSLQRQPR